MLICISCASKSITANNYRSIQLFWATILLCLVNKNRSNNHVTSCVPCGFSSTTKQSQGCNFNKNNNYSSFCYFICYTIRRLPFIRKLNFSIGFIERYWQSRVPPASLCDGIESRFIFFCSAYHQQSITLTPPSLSIVITLLDCFRPLWQSSGN